MQGYRDVKTVKCVIPLSLGNQGCAGLGLKGRGNICLCVCVCLLVWKGVIASLQRRKAAFNQSNGSLNVTGRWLQGEKPGVFFLSLLETLVVGDS